VGVVADALYFARVGYRAHKECFALLHEPHWGFDAYTAFAEGFEVQVFLLMEWPKICHQILLLAFLRRSHFSISTMT